MATSGTDMTAQLPLELVESHLGSLRRLALQLVGDPDAAEDAVQETWLRALQSPPARRFAVGRWLAAVLRNAVRRRRRSERRARSRELSAAGPGAESPAAGRSTVDLVLRRQQLSALAAAVAELPDEQQECVFLRYFEELPPRAIAARIGWPVDRVYRSLAGARARLRRSLAGRDRDWRMGLTALLGLRPVAATPWVGGPTPWVGGSTLWVGGWYLVTKKLLGAVGLALLCVLAYMNAPFADPDLPAGAAPEQPAGTRVAKGPVVAEPDPGTAPAEQRDELARAADALAALAPYEFELVVHARNTHDLPAADVPIRLAPERHVLNRARTDRNGVLRVRFRGRVPAIAMVIACPSDRSSGARLRRVMVHAGQEAVVAVRVNAGRPTATAYLRFAQPGRVVAPSFISVADTSSPALQRDGDGLCWFTDGRAPGAAPGKEKMRQISGYGAFEGGTFTLNFSSVAVQAGGPAAAERTLTGVVFDAAGRPANRALVLVRGREQTLTDAAGRFALKFRAKAGERLEVRAGGGDFGLARTELTIGDGAELGWEARLDRGNELRGQLVDPLGKPLADWHLEIEPEDGAPFIDGAVTDKGGLFAIPNLADRGYRLRAFPPGRALPAFHTGGLRPLGSHVLPVVQVGSGAFQVEPRDIDGRPVAGAEVRLWDDAHGEGRLLVPGKKPKNVLAGEYRMVAGGIGVPLVDRRQVHIGTGQLTDVGALELGEPASLERTQAQQDAPLYHLHPAVPSVIRKGAGRIAVPPGRYRTPGGELTVEPGENRLPDR